MLCRSFIKDDAVYGREIQKSLMYVAEMSEKNNASLP